MVRKQKMVSGGEVTTKNCINYYDEPNITTSVRTRRIRWIGHIRRMEESRIPKIVIISGIGGKKKRGRSIVR